MWSLQREVFAWMHKDCIQRLPKASKVSHRSRLIKSSQPMHQCQTQRLVRLEYSLPLVRPASLHSPPKVVGVKLSREFGIDLYHMHIALCRVPDDRLVVLARRLVRLDVDAQGAV
jgi:hypothetical protein